MEKLLSGNEAFARGAYEFGVTVATGYPGTPSTEILENLVQYRADVYREWAPNEKVAFEVAAGAAQTGARALVTMKHVGLNVAADPLMTLAYTGVKGGFVAIVADDPGMNSSQNEQDTRQFARFAKVPLLEPADSQEAKDFLGAAYEISERHGTPVIVRTTTRVSHSRSMVALGERIRLEREIAFEKNPARLVPIPLWARGMRRRLEERLDKIKMDVNASALNRIERRGDDLGIITNGISYHYAREAFPEASILKLGWSFPFPDQLIRNFAAGVKRVLIVEELDDIIEEHVRSLGIDCIGRDVLPGIGEFSTEVLLAAREKLEGRQTINITTSEAPAADLPGRPPVLCAGCPHRGVYHALAQYNVVVTGDIGCYSLGVLQPGRRFDSLLCMGAGISMAHGVAKAGEKRPVVGIVGDSTFFHSGVTGLMDIAFNQSNVTIIVADNRTTAMTGHQVHPGSGMNLMGESVPMLSIEDLGRACGIRRIRVVDPYNITETIKVIGEEIAVSEPSLIVSRHPCPLYERVQPNDCVHVDQDFCLECGTCLNLGCPAMVTEGRLLPYINNDLCIGCEMCAQLCEYGGITVEHNNAAC